MAMVAEHLSELLDSMGFNCQVAQQSIWENSAPPVNADLILQLMPAFGPADTSTPIITIKPMIADLDHPATIEKIVAKVQELSVQKEAV